MPTSGSFTYGSAMSGSDPLTLIGGIIPWATAREYLGMYSAAEDDTVEQVVLAAISIVERHCNRKWRTSTVTAENHPGGKCAFVLRKHPAASITMVVENGTTLTATDYTYDATSGLLWRGDGTVGQQWHPGPNAVSVTYTSGETELPEEVVEAILGTARALVEERRGGARQVADDYAVPTDLIPRRSRLALSSYVLPAF